MGVDSEDLEVYWATVLDIILVDKSNSGNDKMFSLITQIGEQW